MTQLNLADLTVLLIEPSAMQAKIISNVLRAEGVSKIDFAETGTDAIRYLTGCQPDLIISAMYFSDMTAIELLHSIRAEAQTQDLNFMLISSETSFSMIDPIKQAGVLAVLPKPFNQRDIRLALIAARDTLEVNAIDLADIDIDSLHCLVVDDSKVARRHMRKLLQSCGIDQVSEAENGKEAINMLASMSVDFIITDYNMPEMNGQELVEYLAQSEYSYLPVLMVTSENDGGKLSAVRQAGGCALFDKTIDPASLRATLSNALSH